MAYGEFSALTFQICAGGLLFVESGSELKGGGKAFLKAVPISIILVVVITILVEVVAYGTVGAEALGENGTFIGVAELIFPLALFVFFFTVIGPLFATGSTLHSYFTLLARDMLVVSHDKVLPASLNKVNKKFGSPHWAVTVLFISSAVIAFFNPTIVFLSTIINVGATTLFSITLIAAMIVPKKYPEIYNRALYKPGTKLLNISSSISVAIMIVFLLILFAQLKLVGSLVFIAIFAVGFVLSKFKKVKAFDLDDFNASITEDAKS